MDETRDNGGLSSPSAARIAGRGKFHKHKGAINFLVVVFKWFPVGLCECLWALSNILYGHFGVTLRYLIAKKLAKSCGELVYFGANVTVRYWENLVIGSNVSIHANCYLDALGDITLGDNVAIAHNSSLLSSNHSWEDEALSIKENPCVRKAVVIADDVWIGCGVRVLAGVHLSRRCVVAAGAVVNRDVAPRSVVAGVPAKVVKQI